MIIDARLLPDGKTVKCDICIVGAGVAGIALAHEFISCGQSVILLESGGLGPDNATQSLLWGENIGRPYFPLDTSRAAGFGGSSNRWRVRIGDERLGARMRPLDEIDFEERDWVPNSGWPFRKTHLNPFYERAHIFCRMGPFTYDVHDWEEPDKTPRLPLLNGRVQTVVFQFSPRDVFIKDSRGEIVRADNIALYTYVNAVEIETDRSAQSVSGIRVSCLSGREFRISANRYVLALGAIETPRLMLISNRVHRLGIGNQYDLVGRFFMEHIHLWSGVYLPSSQGVVRFAEMYKIHSVRGTPIMGKLSLSNEVLRRERLLNYCVSIHSYSPDSRPPLAPSWPIISWPLLDPQTGLSHDPSRGGSAKTSVLRIIKKGGSSVLRHLGRTKGVLFRLNHMTEQAPNAESRITLAEERDPLGRRRVRLDWRLSPTDINSITRAQEIMDQELRRANLGRLNITAGEDIPPALFQGGWHHMGTTRMHTDARKGVVDENCQVHGMNNLFIAGPSVFPTCGYANPALTIVALSIRLADYLKRLAA